jgi:hypothetical protein
LIYLIQGVWFQQISKMGIAQGGRFGTVAVLRTVLCSSMYGGGFGPSLDDPEKLDGYMIDRAGEAELTDIQMDDDTLIFTKRYLHRDDLIGYSFKKQPDGTWEGGYLGCKEVGEGTSRCIITEVPDDFLVRRG